MACKLEPLKIDPCAVRSPTNEECYAVPLNQPDKQPYDRPIEGGDICVTPAEYAKLQKAFQAIMQKCGDNCK